MDIGKVREFYDSYVPSQLSAGVNERHVFIRDLALVHGMQDGMRVLEMGCGVGTLTGLLARSLPHGTLHAVDLSPASIEIAKKELRSFPQVEFFVADVVTAAMEGKYDMIILPDVLEHIPEGRHLDLFKRAEALLSGQGRMLIHSPDAYYLEWLQINRPELLQMVDIPLHLPGLLETIGRTGLILHHFQRHCIWTDRPDYMALVLVHDPAGEKYTWPSPRPPGFFGRIRRRARGILNR